MEIRIIFIALLRNQLTFDAKIQFCQSLIKPAEVTIRTKSGLDLTARSEDAKVTDIDNFSAGEVS